MLRKVCRRTMHALPSERPALMINDPRCQEFQRILINLRYFLEHQSRFYPSQLHLVNTTLSKFSHFVVDDSPRKESLSVSDRTEINNFFTRIVKSNDLFGSFVDASLKVDETTVALNVIKQYRIRNDFNNLIIGNFIVESSIYESFCKFFATQGNWIDLRSVLIWMDRDRMDKTPSVFLSGFECLGRCLKMRNYSKEKLIFSAKSLLEQTLKLNINILEHIKTYENKSDSINFIVECLNATNDRPDFESGYSMAALLNEPNLAKSDLPCPSVYNLPFAGVNSFSGVFSSPDDLIEAFRRQFKLEQQSRVSVKPILGLDGFPVAETPTELQSSRFATLMQERKIWRRALTRLLEDLLIKLGKAHSMGRITTYPFLKLLPVKDYVEIVLQTLDMVIGDSNFQFSSVSLVAMILGDRVEQACRAWNLNHLGALDHLESIYATYARVIQPTSLAYESFGEAWANCWQENVNPSVNSKAWSSSVKFRIGRELYRLMYDLKFNLYGMNSRYRERNETPILYEIVAEYVNETRPELKVHPRLIKWYKSAAYPELTFSVCELPMLCPPIPRVDSRHAGYLFSSNYATSLIRHSMSETGSVWAIKDSLEGLPDSRLRHVFETLNILSNCPWNVNQPVLDAMMHVAKTMPQGDKRLCIFKPSEKPASFSWRAATGLTKEQAKQAFVQAKLNHKQFDESRSLWASTLYCLSIAEKYRNETFYFPHSVDFRGRAYPCPPHFSYMGSDLSRGLLKFAKKLPLGETGFNWLLIHLTNLTGLKKRASNGERLAFGESLIEEVCDSAEKPFTGRQWWREQEEPWQVLACCKEIHAALRHDQGVRAFPSQFPVHQDGSCNGLQHYAALGRDIRGAASVNLLPTEHPRDLYGEVAQIVEEQRRCDAEAGSEIAQLLAGFVQRKVIKQSIMTTVYGVTLYGAIAQIKRQLKDLDAFPKEHLGQASVYLAKITLASIDQIFTSSRDIQDWFGHISDHIARNLHCRVSWETPLGLPVIQPYIKQASPARDMFYEKECEFTTTASSKRNISEDSLMSLDVPDIHRQKNAFPPNFIHSLDSCHMMLTALHCFRRGVTFTSVHDCFWTHACMVEQLNEICREQFIALHSEPILENLAQYLRERFAFSDAQINRMSCAEARGKAIAFNNLLNRVPPKGNLDLNAIRESVYFFS